MIKEQYLKSTKSKLQKTVNSPLRIHSKMKQKSAFTQNNYAKNLQIKLNEENKLKQRSYQKTQNSPQVLPTKIIFGNVQYPVQDLEQYLRQLHQSLIYSLYVLGSPNDHILKQKIISLPQSKDCKKRKILLLDLQQTLVYTNLQTQSFDAQLGTQNKIKLNVRPFCSRFLQNMSQHYQIYIFTSCQQQYARPIVEYLNNNKKYIRGILAKNNCFVTRSGVTVKDLRIIQNRDLSQIVIIDSVAHCFGLQIQNGIPIIPFKGSKTDRQLLGLQKLLLQLKDVDDVRPFLSSKLQLRKCCEMSEQDFVKQIKLKNMNIKKKTSLF